MKITTLLLFVSAFCLFAENTHSQNTKVTINQRNTQLENVLDEIEIQTNYLFVYNKHVDVNRKVSVRETNVSLEYLLENLFKGTNVSYAVEGSYIILSSKDSTQDVTQQKKMITGTVVDTSGEPVIHSRQPKP